MSRRTRLGRRQLRRRIGERRAGRRLEHRGARRAIEAERALHERALRAAEQARALERARRLVAGVEPLDHDRAIEHGVDRARELRDRRRAERRLELVARLDLALGGELRRSSAAARALAGAGRARAAAEIERLELAAQIAERLRALARVLDEQAREDRIPAGVDVRRDAVDGAARGLAEVLRDEVGPEERQPPVTASNSVMPSA